MSGPGDSRQQHVPQDDASRVELPRDVWNLILAAASAPLRQVPDGGNGRASAARWQELALVCKQWRDIMWQQPIGLRLDDGSFRERPEDAHILRPGSAKAVSAMDALTTSCMPVCRLHVIIDERMLTSAPEEPPGSNQDINMTAALGELLESKHFQAVSGPHLIDVVCKSGLLLRAPPEAFPNLQHLSRVHTRLHVGLPPSLRSLGLQGELCVSFGSGFISAAEVGARTDHAIPLIAPLRQLSKLTFFSCLVSKEMLAALPPSLTLLRLRQCQVAAGEHDFPRQLCRTSYEVDHAGLFSGTFELAAGMVIHDPRRQLAPAAASA